MLARLDADTIVVAVWLLTTPQRKVAHLALCCEPGRSLIIVEEAYAPCLSVSRLVFAPITCAHARTSARVCFPARYYGVQICTCHVFAPTLFSFDT